MSENEIARQKVLEMARLSMLTDRISEVHIKNLQMYPFVFFENVTSVKIDYDLSNKLGVDTKEDTKNADIEYSIDSAKTNHLRVSYRLTLNEKSNDNLERRFAAIEESTRTLFWKQVSVEVYFNDKKVYGSKNV